MSNRTYSNNVAGGNSRVHYGDVIGENVTINYDGFESRTRSKIMTWLKPGDPSIEHNACREKHEGSTGSWLIEGPEYNEWKATKNSFLWLNAGAGAGKSVLCSTVIEDIHAHYQGVQNQADAYWYFTFSDNQKQSVNNCLRSIIAQLYKQCKNTPDTLENAFNDSRDGQHQPSRATLLKVLRAIITDFKSVFVVIDALDECPKTNDERDKLLDTIGELLSWKCPSLHMVCTSRTEIDIENAFRNSMPPEVAFQTVKVSGNEVTVDIATFIRSKLRGRKFVSWDTILKEDVETKLTQRANGMFRLAALQLEELSKALSKSAIRSAVEHLPTSLDGFYERLLLDIPNDVKHQAFRALQWLAFAARPISVKELAEVAVASNECSPYVNPDNRLLDPQGIFEIISSGLVSRMHVSEDFWSENTWLRSCTKPVPMAAHEFVQLAHFSVKEYLVSTRIRQSRVQYFRLDEIEAHEAIAEVSIVCFLQEAPKYSRATGANKAVSKEISTYLFDMFFEAPLLLYASKCWPYHIKALGNQTTDKLASMMMELFTDDHTLRLWDSIYVIGRDKDPNRMSQSIIDMATRQRRVQCDIESLDALHPMIYASLLGLLPLVRTLISNGYNDAQTPSHPQIGRPLAVAAFYGHTSVVRALLDANASVESRGWHELTSLQAACLNGHLDIARILLEAGADINAPEVLMATH